MRALALAVVVALAPACSDPPDEPAGCEVRGCPGDAVCEEGVCVAGSAEDYRVAIRFAAPDPARPPQWVGPIFVSELRSTFRFDALVEVRGSVSGADSGSPGARIELSRPSPLPRRAPIVHGTVAPEGDYSVLVPPGDGWELQASPLDPAASWAPVRRTVDVVEPDRPDSPLEIDLEIADTTPIRGKMTLSNGQESAGVRVRALDSETGQVISTLAVTRALEGPEGSIGGDFEIRVPVGTQSFTLRASGSESGASLPTIDFPIDLADLIFHEEDGSYEIPAATLAYPELGLPITLSGTVEGRPRGGGRLPIGGASLRFSSQDLGDERQEDVAGSVERLITSEPDGSFDVALYRGTYDVEVLPPGDSSYADLAVARVKQFVNAPDQDPHQRGIAIDVPSRFTFAGQVLDSVGSPLAGARVQVAGGGSLSNLDLAAEEPVNHSATTSTSPAGAFLVQVDKGHFDVTIEPAQGSGLPWALFPAILVEADVAPGETFVVSPGQALRGVVRDVDNAPLAGVAVEVWLVREDDSSSFCASGVTDATGAYSLLLPARP